MKNLNTLDKYRVPLFGNVGDGGNGAFEVPYKSCKLRVIASDGWGWVTKLLQQI